MKRVCIIMFLLMACLVLIAQVPQMINYQGLARNSLGQPLQNQNIQIRLSVRDSVSSGTVIFSETRAVTTNQFGLFSIVINGPGASSVTGNLSAVNWSKNNKFLQMEIDPAGGSAFVNLGATQLLSVPFALYAANGFSLPFSATQSLVTDPLVKLTNTGTTGTEGAIQGFSSSEASNATAIRGTISSATPGVFSAAVRGINNGTNSLGIGVWGSQNGGGWGVYGTSNSGIGVFGNAIADGAGVTGQSAQGIAGNFINTTAANASATLMTSNNGTGSALLSVHTGMGRSGFFQQNNTANTNAALEVNSNGTGNAFHSLHTGTGRSGFFNLNNAANASSALEVNSNGTGNAFNSLQTGTGRSGNFQINNAANSNNALEVQTNGTGSTINSTNSGTGKAGAYQITNAASSSNVFESNTNGTGRAGLFQVTNAANSNPALQVNTNGTGIALNAANTGTGKAGVFQLNNAANTSNAIETSTNGSGASINAINSGTGRVGYYQLTNAANTANAFEVTSNGAGASINGINSGTTGRAGLFQLTSAANTNNSLEAVTSGTGRAGFFQVTNSASAGNALQSTSNGTGPTFHSINTGTSGRAGLFQITNNASSMEVMEISTTGTGTGLQIQLTNASNGARAIDILQAGVGPGLFSTSTGGNAVWGITSSISAAGVIGDNTFGEAVVGRNRGGNGVGAVVGRNDSAGYGVRGFNTKNGIGVLGQTGISGGAGTAGRFENVNAANTDNIFEVSSNSATANLAVFIRAGNKARIDANGKGFFNGGTQASGADVAEAFDVTGKLQDYEPGDVLVISMEKDRTVSKSSEPYSSLVAGVYATKPGMLLTEDHIDAKLDEKLPMGILGVLPTKVCTEGGMIHRGDLLVTSSLRGVAMKADPEKIRPGQLIGKALQEYDGKGTGVITVLVNVR